MRLLRGAVKALTKICLPLLASSLELYGMFGKAASRQNVGGNKGDN